MYHGKKSHEYMQRRRSCARRIKYYSWTPGGEIETIHTWNVYLPVEKMYQTKILNKTLTI